MKISKLFLSVVLLGTLVISNVEADCNGTEGCPSGEHCNTTTGACVPNYTQTDKSSPPCPNGEVLINGNCMPTQN